MKETITMGYEDDELFGMPVERRFRFHTESDQGTRGYLDVEAHSEAAAQQIAQRNANAYNAMEQRQLRDREAMERRQLQQRDAMERQYFGSMNRAAGATGSGNGPGAMDTVRTAGRAMLIFFVALILIKILF